MASARRIQRVLNQPRRLTLLRPAGGNVTMAAMPTLTAVTDDQLARLKTDGYLVLPGLAGVDRADRARRRINAHLGKHGLPPDKLTQFATQTYVPEIRDHPDFRALIDNDDVKAVLDDLIGWDTIKPDFYHQIALRFPQPPDADDERIKADFGMKGYHIDGLPSPPGYPHNGVPAGEVHNFTVLVGVILNDQPTGFRGNFRAHPGSHEEMAAHYRQHGLDNIAENGIPQVATAPPHQITGHPGDVILANHLTAHGIAPNLSPDVRYNLFTRLWPKNRGFFGPEAMTDPWHEWKV